MKELYDMIFKRKSVRKFDETLWVTQEELNAINLQLEQLVPLQHNLPIQFKIADVSETTCKRGEYCLLAYSKQNPYFLLNAGYMLEQIDLYLASRDIGICWYGVGKPKETQVNGLDFIIMLAFGKSHPQNFRKDITKCSRKPREAIWDGDLHESIADVVRYAPSSCNMQPWRVVSEEKNINVYRTTNVNSIMPVGKRPFYNTIDMGIFLCFLEIVLEHNHYQFQRTLYEQICDEGDLIKIARYILI